MKNNFVLAVIIRSIIKGIGNNEKRPVEPVNNQIKPDSAVLPKEQDFYNFS